MKINYEFSKKIKSRYSVQLNEFNGILEKSFNNPSRLAPSLRNSDIVYNCIAHIWFFVALFVTLVLSSTL